MTNLLRDILSEPVELARILSYTLGPGRADLDAAARLVRDADPLYITGIGSSWHAGMALLSLFQEAARPACLIEASEMVHFARLARDATVIALSRSGQSVEIVRLMDQARDAGAKVIAVTNTPDSPLGHVADVTMRLEAAFDHSVSVIMYSGIALAAGLLAAAAIGNLDTALTNALATALAALDPEVTGWSGQIAQSDWFAADAPTYLLARGGSLGTCHEARLLWEEAAKSPATALTTGGFRHGPQEIVRHDVRIVLWLDAERMRSEDLTLAEDLRAAGAKVLLIGQTVAPEAGDLVLNIPALPARWQFLLDIVPAQLAAEHLSRLRGVDCDAFVYCPYIVESEGGLT